MLASVFSWAARSRKLALRTSLRLSLLSLMLPGLYPSAALATETTKIVHPAVSNVDEEIFQTLIVMHGLKDLGFDVQDISSFTLADAHKAVASGRLTFMANHWSPLHDHFFHAAGGGARLSRQGALVDNSIQGYMIDMKSARQHGISRFDQLKDPQIAELFDTNGDGKADLTGCEVHWGCARVIEHHLDAYGLRSTVTHNQRPYGASISAGLERMRVGLPTLFYAWTPYWLEAELQPSNLGRWLQVPFSSSPDAISGADTRLADGRNLGFALNTQHVLASREFINAHPDAAALFASVTIPAQDISLQNSYMHQGENSRADIERHARDWIARNRSRYDSWLQQAKAARTGHQTNR